MPFEIPSKLLHFISSQNIQPGDRLPPIPDLANQMGISTGKMREDLEVARELGLVEVRPKTGIRLLDYAFLPAIRTSLLYAISRKNAYFRQFSALRDHLEAAFWMEAAALLEAEDIAHMQQLIERAWRKLQGDPVRIPHLEHRDLHLITYSRLENTFVRGLLEAYWEAYEAVGLNMYADYTYLRAVWTYHQRMVDAIVAGDLQGGYQAFTEHIDLIRARPATEHALASESPVGLLG